MEQDQATEEVMIRPEAADFEVGTHAEALCPNGAMANGSAQRLGKLASLIAKLRAVSSGGGLKARCLRGGAALAVGSIFERGVRFAANMLLARMLALDQFGLMALVLAANGLLETLTGVGVRQAVVQNKRGDSAEFVNVAWWFSAVRGVFLYVAGLVAAPWIANFYGEPALVPLLRVAFLSMLFVGLTNPQLYVLEKRLEFGRYVWMVQGSALAGTLLTLVVALWVPNVWSLVLGFVTAAGFRCIVSFAFCPVHLCFCLDRQAWKELFRFSRGMMGLPILTFLFMQADIFFLGKLCGKELLGLYSMALLLSSIPEMLFTRIALPMVLPVLADSGGSMVQLRVRLLGMTRLLFLFGLPMTICLAVFSRSILTVVWGAQYGQVSVAYGLLTIYTILYTAGLVIASAYMAVGRLEVHRGFTVVRLVLVALILYPAIRLFGPTGAAAARVVSMIVAGIVQQINLSRLIGLPIRQYMAALTEGAIFSAVLLLPAFSIAVSTNSAYVQLVSAIVLCNVTWGYILWTKRRALSVPPAEP
jgi:lipopolysaccharide exporter